MNQFKLFSKTAKLFELRKEKQEIIKAVENAGLLNPAMSVLDVGGGTGKIMSWIKPQVKRTVVLDPSPGMIEQCKKRDMECVLGKAEEIPFPNATFDLVMMNDVFHHLGDKEASIREISRILAPSSSVVIEEFDPKTLRGCGVVLLEKFLRLGSTFYTPKEFEALWQKFGFSSTILKTYRGRYIVQFKK